MIKDENWPGSVMRHALPASLLNEDWDIIEGFTDVLFPDIINFIVVINVHMCTHDRSQLTFLVEVPPNLGGTS